MTDRELDRWVKSGIFPLAGEEEEAFLQRAERFPKFKPAAEHQEAGAVTEKIFGFTAYWMPVVYSNKKLPFWEAAAAWIDPDQFPYVQLRTAFQKGSYFGIRRFEVLAHESVHAVRMGYNEPVFEEILAYRTASRGWRRFFGPLFRNPSESLFFLLSAAAGSFCTLIGVYFAWLLPLLLLIYYGGRLILAQRLLARALQRYPLSALVWLTDREIQQAARGEKLDFGGGLRERALRILKYKA